MIQVIMIVGRIGFSIISAYVRSKFGLEGLSESMAYELMPFGFKTAIINQA
ncbi:MAG TPA: hypothetical protein VFJ51_07055 [Nitrososphaeraceae archaeon]|nr:hypothetical protein [Nitrososphaeraceae archaeon]